jgi:CheY-like chemotaxis protein
VMRQLRAQKDFEHLPVIVFSNTYLTNMVEEAWKAGATKCLSKAHCTPRQVIDAVRSILQPNGAAGNGSAKNTPTPATLAAAAGSDADSEFQAKLRRDFIAEVPNSLKSLRTALQALIKAENENERLKQIQELYRRAHSLSSNAGLAGVTRIAAMADALEALLKELQEKPKNINTSTLRTVAAAVDFMGLLLERTSTTEPLPPPAEVLVVDDEAISRRAIIYALEKANLKSVSVGDPVTALDLLSQKHFDLVFLDVDMPSMNGFELCTRIRTLPSYARTPVVFVTALNDLENRANSSMSGGNDFITKPFLFIELTVKALVHVMRSRLESNRK